MEVRRILILAVALFLVAVLGAVLLLSTAPGESPHAHIGEETFTCPVCLVEDPGHSEYAMSEAVVREHDSRSHTFCSQDCFRRFKENPALFLATLADWMRAEDGPTAAVPPSEDR